MFLKDSAHAKSTARSTPAEANGSPTDAHSAVAKVAQ